MATEQLLLVFSLYRLCVCSCFCVSSGASQKYFLASNIEKDFHSNAHIAMCGGAGGK